jgi:hypothetical protein
MPRQSCSHLPNLLLLVVSDGRRVLERSWPWDQNLKDFPAPQTIDGPALAPNPMASLDYRDYAPAIESDFDF